MRTALAWLVVLALMAGIGFSALTATRAQKREQPSFAQEPAGCRVLSYDLAVMDSTVITTVQCADAGDYRVRATVRAEGVTSEGEAEVSLSANTPTTVNVQVEPPLPQERQFYMVEVKVAQS